MALVWGTHAPGWSVLQPEPYTRGASPPEGVTVPEFPWPSTNIAGDHAGLKSLGGTGGPKPRTDVPLDPQDPATYAPHHPTPPEGEDPAAGRQAFTVKIL